MLIKDLATLKSFLAAPATSGLKWESIKPVLMEAEIKYLMPAIGTEIYQIIDDAYNTDPVSLTSYELALLPYMQKVVAFLGLYLYSFQADVTLGDAGIQRQETPNSKTAYKYQLLALRDSLMDSGFEGIERLLDYLEKNANLFPAWESSDARVYANELLIRSGRELKKYYSGLRQPQRIYMAMISMIRTVEDLTITPIVGDTFGDLKAHDQAGSLTIFEKAVTETLKKAVVHLAISKGIVQLDIRIDDTGLTQLGNGRIDTTRGEDSNRAQADGKNTQALADQCWSIGLSYLNAAVRYLSQNATDTVFPTWYAKLQAEALAAPQPKDFNHCLNGAFSF